MKNALISAHLEQLASRAIPPEVAARNRLHTTSAREVAKGLYGPDTSFQVHGDAIAIPYAQADGAEMLGDDGVPYVRYRVIDTRDVKSLREGEKLQRYLARPGCGMRPYIPAQYADLAGSADFVVVTEGEFKAIASTAGGVPAIGLPGVTMWAAETGGVLTAETAVHPALLEALQGHARGVLVLADSDARGNANVRHAMSTLADALTAQTGIQTMYACVPEPTKVQGKKTSKLGLDDWIAASGAGAVEKYLNWLWSKEMSRQALLAAGGYYPLGTNEDLNYVWSIPRGAMFALSSSALTQPGTLMNVAGGIGWCEAAYGRETKGGVMVDWQRMGGEIVSACIGAGTFSPEHCRRTGVWEVDKASGALVINGADSIWRTDGLAQDRFGAEHVYPVGRKLGLTPDVPVATAQEVCELWNAISTWHWKEDSGSVLMLGWTLSGFLCGASRWRAHLSLTGSRGTGKSFLQNLVARILGQAAIQCDGDSTPAGIRQYVKSDALALLIDEAEADGTKLGSILSFLRSASDGKEVLRGTQDQAGTKFKLNVAGMVAGIVPPLLNAADQSRFIRLELKGVNAVAAAKPHPLVADSDAAEALGLKIFARMVRAWPRLKHAEKVLRRHVGGDPRYADTIAPILAAAWVGLFDEEINDAEAASFVAELHLEDERSRVTEAQDEQNALDHMLGKVLRVQIDSKSLELTGAEIIVKALAEAGKGHIGEYQNALGRYGMRAKFEAGDAQGTLLINEKSPQFCGIFNGTKWENGDLAPVLKRLPMTRPKKTSSTVSINKQSVRAFEIELPSLDHPVMSKALATAADLT